MTAAEQVQARLASLATRAGAAAMTEAAGDALRPYVPVGTEGWLVAATRGEPRADYAIRAVRFAAARAAWAGGLTDGTWIPDDAVCASVAWLVRR